MTGNLVLVRYDARRGCIEGLRILAKQGIHSFESWDWNPEVIIHTFNPQVKLFVDDPIVKIDMGMYAQHNSAQEEIMMNTGYSRGVRSMISLCHAMAPDQQDQAMALWPSSIIPARERVRSESRHLFRGEGHRPKSVQDASEDTFRIRKWVEFGGLGAPLGVHVGEDVMTFSTVPEQYYTPTKEKPWQGIWVGDYSGHGCEFLLLIQCAVDGSLATPKSASKTPLQHHFDGSDPQGRVSLPVPNGEDGHCAGRLEAIKLTGDPNVPRGEYTWVAEDIGPRGLLRIADEKIFKGARVVRSLGHSAGQGFRDAQYWQIVGIVIASLIVGIALYILLITLRTSHSNPRFLPTSFLKNRWRAWKPKTMKYRMFGFDPISPLHNDGHFNSNANSRASSRHGPSLTPRTNDRNSINTTEMTATNDETVNRNTSVRSIMTLPPYRPSPLPSERLIAREGERAGVDTVVEFPETAEDEEARREADMEELYQIRTARRRENDERRERRQARREARAAGDTARLEQLRIQTRLAEQALRIGGGSAGSSSTSLPRNADQMLAEHQARAESRERRVSSVSYADLGLARHDGSRIRADSMESDHRPLLDSAASMASSRHGSFAYAQPRLGPHYRNMSSASIMSTDSEPGQIITPYTSHRSGSDPPLLTPSATQGSSGSDRDDVRPGEEPPRYEDEEAPPYTSPVTSRAPQLPPLANVPSIEVEVATPASSVPATPIEHHTGGR
ncbi:MAG: hypothetical protein Q9182_005470 [Xanthomendoza sp. 2 TL-2023]